MPKQLQIEGQRFGRLVAIEPVSRSSQGVVWRCQCDCGGFANVRANKLRNGWTQSCGCIHRENAAERSRARRAIADENSTKVCNACHVALPLDAFDKHPKGMYGRNTCCKPCNAKKKKDYAAANVEKQARRRKELRDPVKAAARWKKISTEQPERIAAYAEKYREKKKAYSKVYHRANPDKRRADDQRRKSRMRGSGGSFSAKEWRALQEKYNHRCLRCGEVKPLSVDHVIPIALGGTNDIANIQPLCLDCNRRKSNKHIDYRTLYE